MPKFVVSTVGTVQYSCQLVLEAESVVEVEALALNVMPSIDANTCDNDGDLTNVTVNEVEELEEGDELPDNTYTHIVHASAKVGRETFFVSHWACGTPEYRVYITLPPSSMHPDGYVYEKGKFADLDDAMTVYQAFVDRAEKAAALVK